MAKLTKADAARQLGIARSTLYKLIDQGKVSPTPEGLIDSAELVRVAPSVDVLHERTRTSAPSARDTTAIQGNTPYGRPQTAVRERTPAEDDGRPQTSSGVVVDILREQLQTLREELQAARHNAQAAHEREALLLRMLHEAQQRYDRLLEAPRAPVVPRDDPRPTPMPLSVLTDPPPGVVDVTIRMPAYHPERHVLGTLCARGHDWQGTGQSLRKRSSKGCLACDAAGQRARRQQRRP